MLLSSRLQILEATRLHILLQFVLQIHILLIGHLVLKCSNLHWVLGLELLQVFQAFCQRFFQALLIRKFKLLEGVSDRSIRLFGLRNVDVGPIELTLDLYYLDAKSDRLLLDIR